MTAQGMLANAMQSYRLWLLALNGMRVMRRATRAETDEDALAAARELLTVHAVDIIGVDVLDCSGRFVGRGERPGGAP